MQMQAWKMAGVAALVLGAAAAAWVGFNRSGESGDGSSAATSGGWVMIRPGVGQEGSTQATGQSSLSAEQVRNKLFREGSFQGTEPNGDWCTSTGKLSPCNGLRRRFEYYLLGMGEVTVADIRTLVNDEARRANGEELGDAIMAMWDKYWRLRTHEFRNAFVQSDRNTWMPAFEEQRMVRRQVLGEDWARAFFDDEEAKFKQYVAQAESGQPPPPDPGEPVPQMAPGKDPAAVHAERVARYGQDAANRLAKADEEWADWERRLAAARVEWERLKTSQNLSDVQRKQDMQAYVSANFKPDEHLRVKALLNL